MTLPTEGTLLVLSSMGVPLYSARGLTQTLEPIQQAFDMRRDINGDLVDISSSAFRKYQSTITCRDFNTPAIDGLTIGQVLTVSCVAELSYKTTGGSATRTPVTNSSRTVGDFTFYRPSLSMMVTGYSASTDEWAGDVAWQLDLEEV